MVPEQRVRTYQVCRMVPEQHVKTCCYKVCRMVTEQCSKEVEYRVCTLVKECRTCQVPVCKKVPLKAGLTCNDGLYCTVGETCDGSGKCGNGQPPLCGKPAQCYASFCSEAAKGCTTAPLTDGMTLPFLDGEVELGIRHSARASVRLRLDEGRLACQVSGRASLRAESRKVDIALCSLP